MAAKVSSSAVSYGIGVQNRYSAFLDDEDAIASGIAHHLVVAKHQAEVQKQQKSHSSAKSNPVKSANNNNKSVTVVQQKQQNTEHKTNSNVFDTQRNNVNRQVDSQNKTRQYKSNNAQTNNVAYSQQSKNQQTNSHNQQRRLDNNHRFSRGNSQQQQTGPHNGTHSNNNMRNNESVGGNYQRGEGRFNNRTNQSGHQRRQFANAEPKKVANLQNGVAVADDDNQIAVATNPEDVKRRRQQKRVADLKHKDTTKRDARRQHLSSISEQADDSNQTNNVVQAIENNDENNRQRKPVNRRREVADSDGSKTGEQKDGEAKNNFRNRRSNLPGRENDGAGVGPKLNGSDQRNVDGPASRRPRGPPRNNSGSNNSGGNNKNGFSRGGNRGFRSNDGPNSQEKSKPIPNFSDKLDFPSLAS